MPYRQHETVAEIERITANGALRGVVALLPYLPPHAHPHGENAALALDALMRGASALELATFDSWFRQSHPDAALVPDWDNVVVPSHSWDAKRHRAVVALATMHASGRVRMSAMATLAEIEDAFTLPLLLLRLNDWVEPIHDLAQRMLESRIDESHVDAWLRALPLLDRLKISRRRLDAIATLFVRVEMQLASPEARDRVFSAVELDDRAISRAAFARAILLPDPRARALAMKAATGNDGEMAFRASRILLGPTGRANATEATLILRTSPFGHMRARALETLVTRLGAESTTLARDALFDEARIVRETARFQLTSKLALTLAAIRDLHRARLDADPRAANVEALSEVATAEDLERLRSFSISTSARARAAAWVGIGRVDPSPRAADYEAALADPSLVVRRAITQYAKRVLGRGVVARFSKRRE